MAEKLQKGWADRGARCPKRPVKIAQLTADFTFSRATLRKLNAVTRQLIAREIEAEEATLP